MSDKKVFHYEGKGATVHWNGRLCIHIGECGRARGELFIGGRQPWCQPDLADGDEIRDVIARCPTGALTVEFADGAVSEVAPSENTIQVHRHHIRSKLGLKHKGINLRTYLRSLDQ